DNAELLRSGEAARQAFAYQQAQRAARQAERAAQQASSGTAEMKDQSAEPALSAARPNPGPRVPQQIYLAEAKVRIDAALGAEIDFVAPLARLWSSTACA